MQRGWSREHRGDPKRQTQNLSEAKMTKVRSPPPRKKNEPSLATRQGRITPGLRRACLPKANRAKKRCATPARPRPPPAGDRVGRTRSFTAEAARHPENKRKRHGKPTPKGRRPACPSDRGPPHLQGVVRRELPWIAMKLLIVQRGSAQRKAPRRGAPADGAEKARRAAKGRAETKPAGRVVTRKKRTRENSVACRDTKIGTPKSCVASRDTRKEENKDCVACRGAKNGTAKY